MLMQDIKKCIDLLSVDGENTKSEVKELLNNIYIYVIFLTGTGKLKEDTYEEDESIGTAC